MKRKSNRSYLKRSRKTAVRYRLSPTQIIFLGFLLLILAGGLLLMLPISSQDGTFTSPIDAMFTAVSSTCVTGLVTVDTATHWNTFGHIVIITLIQIGGLGFMTMAITMSIFIKRRITPREQLLAAQSLGLSGVGGTVSLVRRIVIGTLAVEGIGAVILSSQFIPIFGWADGIFMGIFHSISAFCNAGFDLLGGYGGTFCSFMPFDHNYIIGTTLMLLIIIGGIGFIVWDDIVNFVKSRKKLSVYSKFILTISVCLIIFGAALIAVFEWNNPATLANESGTHKLFAALFQSVSTRTAGIDMIGNANLTGSSKLVSMLLMFIGGASGSTAGGIKVGTFGIIICAMLAFSKGTDELVISKRRVPHETVIRALTVVGMDLIGAFAVTLIIAATNDIGIMESMYDAISGIATVGLTLGITPTLGTAAKISLMVLMFFGRVGVLTITYSIMLKSARKNSCIRYPDIDMMIG